jgi:hypothetical protein
VGPPPPGAIRGLGVLAMLLSPLKYASDAPLSTRFLNPFFPQACDDFPGSYDLVHLAFLLLGSMRTIAVVCDERLGGAAGSCHLERTPSLILYQPVLSIPEDTPDIESNKTFSTSSLSGESVLRARSWRNNAT